MICGWMHCYWVFFLDGCGYDADVDVYHVSSKLIASTRLSQLLVPQT